MDDGEKETDMSTSPQIMEMLHDLREDELARVSVHRIEAITQRPGVRSTVASALVRAGMRLDRDAAAHAVVAPQGDHGRTDDRSGWDFESALHW
jgi:hypothetical protein